MGLFLAETANPDRIWELTVLNEDLGAATVGVDRADSGSILLWRTVSDYGIRAEWLKLFFNTQSKQLIGRVWYSPVAVGRLLVLEDELYLVANMRERPLVVNWEAEGSTLVTEAQQLLDRLPGYLQQLQCTLPTVPFVGAWNFRTPDWDPRNDRLWKASGERFSVSVGKRHGLRFFEGVAERIGDGHKLYPVPQSSEEEYLRARSQKTEVGSIEEEIGPYQVVGDRFWFGKLSMMGKESRELAALAILTSFKRSLSSFRHRLWQLGPLPPCLWTETMSGWVCCAARKAETGQAGCCNTTLPVTVQSNTRLRRSSLR